MRIKYTVHTIRGVHRHVLPPSANEKNEVKSSVTTNKTTSQVKVAIVVEILLCYMTPLLKNYLLSISDLPCSAMARHSPDFHFWHTKG